MVNFLEFYNRVTVLPFGKYIFSKSVGLVAPFFGKIKPSVLALKPAYCAVEIQDRRGVRNHIGSINAGALCTLAELTAGMAMDATIPDTLRWIPKSMCVEYQQKAIGKITAICSFDASIVIAGDVVLPVIIENKDKEQVFKAEITFYISARKIKA